MTYFNTTNEKGVKLSYYSEIASTQNDVILNHFENNPGCRFSPDYIWEKVFNQTIPITSVRRSMTTLTNEGRLRKTDSKCIGVYGRPVHRWELTNIK